MNGDGCESFSPPVAMAAGATPGPGFIAPRCKSKSQREKEARGSGRRKSPNQNWASSAPKCTAVIKAFPSTNEPAGKVNS